MALTVDIITNISVEGGGEVGAAVKPWLTSETCGVWATPAAVVAALTCHH